LWATPLRILAVGLRVVSEVPGLRVAKDGFAEIGTASTSVTISLLASFYKLLCLKFDLFFGGKIV
jgi:hypothetical protein